jgi:hypothetical protein
MLLLSAARRYKQDRAGPSGVRGLVQVKIRGVSAPCAQVDDLLFARLHLFTVFPSIAAVWPTCAEPMADSRHVTTSYFLVGVGGGRSLNCDRGLWSM